MSELAALISQAPPASGDPTAMMAANGSKNGAAPTFRVPSDETVKGGQRTRPHPTGPEGDRQEGPDGQRTEVERFPIVVIIYGRRANPEVAVPRRPTASGVPFSGATSDHAGQVTPNAGIIAPVTNSSGKTSGAAQIPAVPGSAHEEGRPASALDLEGRRLPVSISGRPRQVSPDGPSSTRRGVPEATVLTGGPVTVQPSTADTLGTGDPSPVQGQESRPTPTYRERPALSHSSLPPPPATVVEGGRVPRAEARSTLQSESIHRRTAGTVGKQPFPSSTKDVSAPTPSRPLAASPKAVPNVHGSSVPAEPSERKVPSAGARDPRTTVQKPSKIPVELRSYSSQPNKSLQARAAPDGRRIGMGPSVPDEIPKTAYKTTQSNSSQAQNRIGDRGGEEKAKIRPAGSPMPPSRGPRSVPVARDISEVGVQGERRAATVERPSPGSGGIERPSLAGASRAATGGGAELPKGATVRTIEKMESGPGEVIRKGAVDDATLRKPATSSPVRLIQKETHRGIRPGGDGGLKRTFSTQSGAPGTTALRISSSAEGEMDTPLRSLGEPARNAPQNAKPGSGKVQSRPHFLSPPRVDSKGGSDVAVRESGQQTLVRSETRETVPNLPGVGRGGGSSIHVESVQPSLPGTLNPAADTVEIQEGDMKRQRRGPVREGNGITRTRRPQGGSRNHRTRVANRSETTGRGNRTIVPEEDSSGEHISQLSKRSDPQTQEKSGFSILSLDNQLIGSPKKIAGTVDAVERREMQATLPEKTSTSEGRRTVKRGRRSVAISGSVSRSVATLGRTAATASNPVFAKAKIAPEIGTDSEFDRFDFSAKSGANEATVLDSTPEPAEVASKTTTDSLTRTILRLIDRLNSGRSSTLRVKLSTPGGGQLVVRLQVDGNRVNAVFQTESTEIQEKLEQGWNRIAELAAFKGVRLVTPRFEHRGRLRTNSEARESRTADSDTDDDDIRFEAGAASGNGGFEREHRA